MRLIQSLSTLLLAVGVVNAATWDFKDGSVKIKPKKGEVVTQSFTSSKPSSLTLDVTPADNIIVSLSPSLDGKVLKPHQVMLMLRDIDSGLEAPFGFAVRESGKSIAKLTFRDIPTPLQKASKLEAHLILGSFGSEKPLNKPIFSIAPKPDDKTPFEAPGRYEKKSEINHIFRPDPQSPPKTVSLVFALAVVTALPILFGSWLGLGANLCHLKKALSSIAAIPHILFFGSIVAMEGVFFMYYTAWNLFQVLPLMAILSATAVLSGSRALGEVQARRLAGER
ncbi:Dolichyl-diphosphooligosaccharide--protein glycosyltransferase subunit 2 [Ceratocystis fimbriata CBS 114723]|uniref:Dolichyl-diphosphooligosaccharide--protein glycosyltransferase subunit 2 n=1 Tax=Ceratocystis fimbriata CBS 114723 TaxID=1035309 RepID=A0A2C5WXW4_9PEZI|nr:Dolichyl-diphosphooligosaccharide--protein glycosyltransferase subunit 2 [Ceratocystis fimbriata CBS 114723]